ncbi:MAG TPA: helix-turn-helix domain-containing protein [Candidatus Bathyarchaeia archaeon]|nr:helix-turn-helix domain-containing protein [Candidatus Bathyarchaeia archaeon]
MTKKIRKLLTLKQAADILNVSPATLRRLDNEDRLKAVRIGSRRGVGDRRYRPEDIESYIERQKK